MQDQVQEAKTDDVEQPKSVDEQMDEVLDTIEQEKTPSDSSSEKQTTDTEKSKESEEAPTGTDQTKPDDEAKEDKPKDEDVPKEFHKHPAWKRIMEERNKAQEQIKELEGKETLSTEDKEKLEKLNEVTSSREYIEASMKAQGYTPEAINKALSEKGFEVDKVEAPDDFTLVTKTLNIDPKTLTSKQQGDIQDIAKISRIVAENIISNKLYGNI